MSPLTGPVLGLSLALALLHQAAAQAPPKPPPFATPQFQVGEAPFGLVVADLDGDGLPDVASVQGIDDTLTVFKGYGDGRFALHFTKGVFSGSIDMAAGDMDGDGDGDLVTVTPANEVAVQRNLGNGTFTGVGAVFSPNAPRGIALGDVDEDGDLDAVASLDQVGGVNVHLNGGDADLGPAATYPASSSGSEDVVLVDVDLDGHLDAVVSCGNLGSVDILHGDGRGAFGAPLPIEVGPSPTMLATGNLNGDGWPDIVVLRPSIQGGSGLLSDGAGGFHEPKVFGLGVDEEEPAGVAIADLDADGAADIVLGAGDAVFVAFGNGVGGLKALRSWPSGEGSRTVVPFDVDGDGALDVVAADITGQTFALLRGDGEGGLATAKVVPATSTVGFVAAGDLDEDGDVDLAAASGTVVSTLANDGDGGFTPGPGTATPADTTSAVVRDFDGDGHLDLLSTHYSPQQVTLHRGDGSGGFAAPSSLDLPTPIGVAAGDLDGDGDVDAVVASYGTIVPPISKLHVLINDGSGAFAAPVTYSTGSLPQTPALADLDGDADLDLLWVISSAASSAVARMLNDGAGGFSALATTPYPSASALAVGDVDEDGDLDVVAIANQTHTRAAHLNDGNGNLAAAVVAPTVDYPEDVALADVDCDGQLDTVVTSALSGGIGVHRGDGHGGFGDAELFVTGSSPTGLVVQDLDADGHDDVATVHAGSGVHVLLGSSESGWCGLGGGLAGAHGIPQLQGTGTLAGGTSVGLSLTSALENTAAVLVLGFSELDAPFKGGVLVPQPQVLIAGLPTGPLGALALSATMPPGLPSHLHLYVQDLVLDPAAPAGFAISTAVLGTTP